MLSSVPFQELAARPFDGQEVEPAIGLSDLDRAYHVGVLNASAVLGLSYKACNSRSVKAELLSEYLQRHCTVRLVSSFIDG